MELEFIGDGKPMVLRALANGVPKIVTTKRIKTLFRHGEVAWAGQCFMSSKISYNDNMHHHVDI